MTDLRILRYLALHGAVLTDSHFIYTSGMHGTAYINMRAVAHKASWLMDMGWLLAERIDCYGPDLIIGPETLGRTLAGYVEGPKIIERTAIWCDLLDEGGEKRANFSLKLDFGRLVSGKKVAIVDDLLTTGGSIRLVAELIARHGGEVVAAAVVVRRTSEVTAVECGVSSLEVLADISGFTVFTPEECAASGPCSRRVPVALRPGHGWKWIESHEGYPTV